MQSVFNGALASLKDIPAVLWGLIKAQYDKAQAFVFEYTVAHVAYIVLFVAGFALGIIAR
jgi:hypothetical protein